MRSGPALEDKSPREISFQPFPDAHAGILRARKREETCLEICEGMIDLVSAFFNVPSKELRRPGRAGADVARVRQIAMYVAHVALRLTMKEVGLGFGRDRTTVLHACHLIEDRRDDVDFDQVVHAVERLARMAFAGRAGCANG